MTARAHLVSMLGLLASGCGGGQASSEAPRSTAAAASEAAATPSGGRSYSGPPNGGAGGTTTTVALANAGDPQGAKLSETHSVTTNSGGAPRPASRGHEPGREPGVIRAMIIAHRDEARACYDAGLAAHAGIEGDLVVRWTIDPSGKVTQVSPDMSRSTITEPSVVACVAGVIQKLLFSASPGGYETEASYPFNFHPHRGGRTTNGP